MTRENPFTTYIRIISGIVVVVFKLQQRCMFPYNQELYISDTLRDINVN